MTEPVAANDAPAEEAPQDFNATKWECLIGIRTVNNTQLEISAVVDPLAMVPTKGGENRPDKTIPAVYFVDWFERNKLFLVSMCEREYTQYVNLHRLTAGRKAVAPPAVGLVDVSGQRLGSNDTTQ